MHLLVLASLFACGLMDDPSPLDLPPAAEPTRPAPYEVTAIPLARRAYAVEDLLLPTSSRPDGETAPEEFGLIGPLVLVGTFEGAVVYQTPLPIHSNLLPTALHGTHVFGSAAPPGLAVRGPDGPFRFARKGRANQSYGFDREFLYLGFAPAAEVPDWEAIRIRFPKATDHEDDLNRDASLEDDSAFIARTVTLDELSTSGLYLPAPGAASWPITVPERAVFTTRGTVLPPPIKTLKQSDGASAVFELLDGGTVLEVKTVDLTEDSWEDVRWDLSDYAGRELTLRVRSEPGATSVYDYVFLEEPTVYTPSDNPKRTVLVFVDTLRPDHLGIYGYARATSPTIDRWAAHGAVFDEARSVAPWTLPSARTALSGHQPEDWYDTDNIAEQFGDAGFATEAIVTNAFLSQPFDMHRGWSRFEYRHLLPADQVTDAAQAAMDRHPDRDLLLLVHYMDAHLPYEEPAWYRYRWARLSPDGHEPTRARLYALTAAGDKLKAVRNYVTARYDQNIRFIDDELRSLLESAGPHATTLLFSDHGEEFWEHGSFEHGHSLHDEVLRVPLIIRGPNVPVGHFDFPVSLLDLTPTALALAGLPVPPGQGQSLVGALYGGRQAIDDLESRPQAFGRPLYEQDGWSVLADGKKWIDRAGQRHLYDLGQDRSEHDDIAAHSDLAPYPAALSKALDREVVRVWRVRPKVRQAHAGFTVRITHPAGIKEAWKSYDPRGRAAATQIEVIDGELLVAMPANADEAPNAIFVVPNGDWADPGGLELRADAPGQESLSAIAGPDRIPEGPQRNVLLTAGDRGWSFLVDTANVPVRSGTEVSGFHADVEAQLRELGYLDE